MSANDNKRPLAKTVPARQGHGQQTAPALDRERWIARALAAAAQHKKEHDKP